VKLCGGPVDLVIQDRPPQARPQQWLVRRSRSAIETFLSLILMSIATCRTSILSDVAAPYFHGHWNAAVPPLSSAFTPFL
jgi:hypothetical protein